MGLATNRSVTSMYCSLWCFVRRCNSQRPRDFYSPRPQRPWAFPSTGRRCAGHLASCGQRGLPQLWPHWPGEQSPQESVCSTAQNEPPMSRNNSTGGRKQPVEGLQSEQDWSGRLTLNLFHRWMSLDGILCAWSNTAPVFVNDCLCGHLRGGRKKCACDDLRPPQGLAYTRHRLGSRQGNLPLLGQMAQTDEWRDGKVVFSS